MTLMEVLGPHSCFDTWTLQDILFISISKKSTTTFARGHQEYRRFPIKINE